MIVWNDKPEASREGRGGLDLGTIISKCPKCDKQREFSKLGISYPYGVAYKCKSCGYLITRRENKRNKPSVMKTEADIQEESIANESIAASTIIEIEVVWGGRWKGWCKDCLNKPKTIVKSEGKDKLPDSCEKCRSMRPINFVAKGGETDGGKSESSSPL